MNHDSVLTLEKILEVKALLEERAPPRPLSMVEQLGIFTFPPVLAGMRVIETPAGYWVSRRVHRRSANSGKASYHRRIQKKWDKRYGRKYIEVQRRGEVFRCFDTLFIRRDDMKGVIASTVVV